MSDAVPVLRPSKKFEILDQGKANAMCVAPFVNLSDKSSSWARDIAMRGALLV